MYSFQCSWLTTVVLARYNEWRASTVGGRGRIYGEASRNGDSGEEILTSPMMAVETRRACGRMPVRHPCVDPTRDAIRGCGTGAE
jgi:hypothetical protein